MIEIIVHALIATLMGILEISVNVGFFIYDAFSRKDKSKDNLSTLKKILLSVMGTFIIFILITSVILLILFFK
jgi:hypothetical protein